MKIAVITSGILPVPAVQGGAVENLIDFYLEYNDIHKLHDITVYSVYHPDVKAHPARHSKVNHYEYVDIKSWWFKLGMRLYGLTHHNDCYYHNLEYFFEKVYKKMVDQQFDLIILENRPGFAIKLKHRLPHITIVSHMHTDMLHGWTPQTEAIIRSTDLFITVSEFIKREIENARIKTSIKVVYNGLDEHQFDRSAKPIGKKAIGFNDNDFVIIFTGRLIPGKGIKDLLHAFENLRDYPPIKLLVVGGVDFSNTKLSSSFLSEIKKIADGLDNKIVFTGFIPYTQLPNYLATAEVMVVPSHMDEAFGMACIEACAMGLPVIATNDGGIPETLIGQKHIIVDKSKKLPVQLATAIMQIKNNYHEYKGNTLFSQFTKDTYCKNFFNCLSQNSICSIQPSHKN